MLPKISIITPSFNQSQFIEQTIQSVLNQNYPNIEYIVIDGGSTDGTIEILKKYNKKISYWISEPDQGQTHAINKGFQHVTGQIFNWLNSDDYLAPGSLHNIAKAFSEGANCVAGYVNNFIGAHSDADWIERTKIYSELPKTVAYTSNRQPGTFFRTEKIRHLFPLPESLHFTMDQDLWLRYLIENGQEKIHLIDDTLVHFRRHADSKTQSENGRFCLGYSKKFFRDYHSIFFQLALKIGENEIDQILMDNFPEEGPVSDYSLNIPKLDPTLGKRILNYYLLQLAGDDYFRDKIHMVKKKLTVLNRKWLDKESRFKYDQLKAKLKFRPIILLKRKLSL
jgi:glycosyltransferase involved in cell wall biosynthesis